MQSGPLSDFRPLGRKAYGSIAHLPGSRTGAADRHLSPGLARLCTERVRDARVTVVVLEKLDGSCVAAARVGDSVLAPFAAFDLMRDGERRPWRELMARVSAGGFVTPGLLHEGGPLGITAALERLQGGGFHGALDPVEGAVWRVERREGAAVRVEFLAKYVRPDKVDGSLLPENTGRAAIWNWRPEAPQP